MSEVVFQGRDNTNVIQIWHNDEPLDFSSINRIETIFELSGVIADSDVDSTLYDWSHGEGIIEFKFSDLLIEPGTYRATINLYDLEHMRGQTIAHVNGEKLFFTFVEPT